MRPEVSATLAAVLDRMTDKDLAHRYADVPSLVADLEEALAIEAARAAAPRPARRPRSSARCPPAPAAGCRSGCATRSRCSAVIALLAVGAAIVALRRRRGRPRAPSAAPAPAGSSADARGHQGRLRPARLRARLRPARRRRGARRRRPRASSTATPGTVWTTESYTAGIAGAGKAGVGIYVDAKPKVDAVAMQIQTPEPGWQGDDLRRAAGRRAADASRTAGRRSAAARSTRSDQRFKLDTGGTAYRYYLVWITKLAPGRRARGDLRDPAVPGSRGGARTLAASRARASKRSSASASSRSQSSGNGTPEASHSFGYTLVAVNPGIVLSSLTSTRSPSSTKKSTRARPAQPTRTNVSQASRRTSSSTALRQPRGHDQLHPARPVLGLVVVPVGALEDDLAGHRGLGLAVAEHRALDLQPGGEALDDHQAVVRERARRAPGPARPPTTPWRCRPRSRAAPA